MRVGWVGIAALILIVLIRLAPYTAAPMLGTVYAAKQAQPAWVPIPPKTRIFAAYESVLPPNSRLARSGRLDLFSQLDLAALKTFYKDDLTKKGFAVSEEIVPGLTPKAAELLGITGRFYAERKADGIGMTVSFAGEEGLLRKSRLFNIVWRIAKRPS